MSCSRPADQARCGSMPAASAIRRAAAGHGQAVQDQILAAGGGELLIGEFDLEARGDFRSQERVADVVGVQAVEDQADGMPLADRAGGLTLGQRENRGGAGGLAFEDVGDGGRRKGACRCGGPGLGARAGLDQLREVLHGDARRNRQRAQLIDGQLHLAGGRRIDVPFRHAATLCYHGARASNRHRWRRSPSLRLQYETHRRDRGVTLSSHRSKTLKQPTARRNSPCRSAPRCRTACE